MRLVTRCDFDGLVCGILLKEKGIINSFFFVHPKDLQDGLFQATKNDILANVPYVPNCGMWFDHHLSQKNRLDKKNEIIQVEGEIKDAPSTAQIIYDYYGGKKTFPHFSDLIQAVDKVDSGNLTIGEILCPSGWILIGFLYDPRTGLGRFPNFRISHFELTIELIVKHRHLPIQELLELPDIKERVTTYHKQNDRFKDMLLKHTILKGSVIVTDLRGVTDIYAGNRFLIYSLFPGQNVSCWIVDGKDNQNISIACGYSIINKSAKINIGELMFRYGGGGLAQVGTCQVPYDQAEQAISDIIEQLKFNLIR